MKALSRILLAKNLDDLNFLQKTVRNFKRPKYLQHSIEFFNTSKALSFLHEANSVVETLLEIRDGSNFSSD